MMRKIFNFLAGTCALLSPTSFFTAMVFLPVNSIAESIALKVAVFSFAMLFVFGLAATFHADIEEA